MKPKYQTRASKAEEQVLEMLKSDKNIQKPWSLVSCDLQNRTLQTTAQEAAIILSHHASLRPGYEQTDGKVFVPNLFVKFSGKDREFLDIKSNASRRRENSFIFDSFESFPVSKKTEPVYDAFLRDGMIEKDRLLSSGAFKYPFLRREYQELYVDKVNEVLKYKEDYFIGRGFQLSQSEILNTLLSIEESFLKAFHHFDFQMQPPAIIITNKGKERIDMQKGLVMVLLNLLGFDILVFSLTGYADIENTLNPNVFTIFYGIDQQRFNPYRVSAKLKRLILATGSAGLIIAVLLSSGLLKSALTFVHNFEPGQAVVENKGLTDQSPSDGTSDSLTFQDSALEKSIRQILGRETGDIYAHDIIKLGFLRFVGPYSGGNGWSFLSGYSMNAYYDTNNVAYSEEGEIKTFPELVQLSQLSSLEVSWQKEIDLSCLKGSRIGQIRLLHDNITDISDISAIESVRQLELGYNYIVDLRPLSKFNLSFLGLQHNDIEDIQPISHMKGLTFLDLCDNPIVEASPLNNLVSMRNLYLYNVLISDFSFLKKMPDLEALNVGLTRFDDLSLLENNKKLDFLGLSYTNIEDISILKDFKRIRTLDISGTKVHDISILKELPALKTLVMFNVDLDDESVLSELKHVEIMR